MFIWKKFVPLNWFLGKLLLRSLISKYIKHFQDLHHLLHHLLSNSPCSLLFLFLAIVQNFIFLPCVVVWNSLLLRSEKGKTSFEQDMQYQAVSSSFSILFVWIFVLLHLRCTYSWHLPHCIALWFFVTGLFQILQGYFIGILKSSYS